MSTSAITNSFTKTDSSVTQNPNAILDKDSFMKLLLTELQYQDPTSPMDTEKILTQTSQLATLESADNTNKTMEDLVNRLNNNMDMGALAAIGKMASLGTNDITLPEKDSANFEVYFEKEIKDGTLTISDTQGHTIKSVPLSSQEGKSGILSFQWDGLNNSGEKVNQGRYKASVDYTDSNGDQLKTQVGIYPVESVRYEDGKPQMKLGSSYVPMENIAEFY